MSSLIENLSVRRGVLGRDRATRELRGLLAKAPGAQETPSPTESATLSIGAGSAQQVDTASGRKVGRRLRKARKAAGRYRAASARVDEFRSGEHAQVMVATEKARITRAKTQANEPVDSEQPPIARWAVSTAETVFLIAEVTFYYGMFTYGVPKNASAITVASHAVLAFLLPVVSLIVARFFAGSVHKLMARQYHSDKRSRAWTFLAVAAGLLTGVCIATWKLVHWRITAQSDMAVTLIGSPPASVIATSFTIAIVAIAAIRAWLIAPTDHTAANVRRRNRLVRFHDGYLRRREIRALTRWQNRYDTLALLVARCLNATDQSMLAASSMIQLNRGTPSNTLALGRNGVSALPYVMTESNGNKDASAVTSARQLDVEQLILPLRILDIAVAYLNKEKPPTHLQHQAFADHIRAAAAVAAATEKSATGRAAAGDVPVAEPTIHVV